VIEKDALLERNNKTLSDQDSLNKKLTEESKKLRNNLD
jgi:hypothetical protein